MWSTHDLACAHCRTRKIRCGRERPECESCKRDGVECRYSSPGKRVNHVKLLCQNFESLEDQLNIIQGDLSTLTSLITKNSAGKPIKADSEEPGLEDESEIQVTGDTCKDRYIVRNETDFIDRYRGPCSLFTLCKEFQDDPMFEDADLDASTNSDEAVHLLLERLCTSARTEEHMSIPSQHVGATLPPKHFLSTVVGQFFKNRDYATDIFVQSNFQVQMDRIYAQSLSLVDEAWAVCFSTIVLLAMRNDRTALNGSSISQPFTYILQMAVNNPRIFLTPRLVNAQALALLSYAAEQFGSPGVADLIFAQACLLAKMMGLHQSRAAFESLSAEEVIERHKVFRSLYIRDKNSAICRGSTTWLPTYDSRVWPLSLKLDPDEAKYTSRLELAHIQDELYRHFHSAEPPNLPLSKRLELLSKMEQKLDRWAASLQTSKESNNSLDTTDLILSFLATRLCIFRARSDPSIAPRALSDAEASCIILLQAVAPRSDPELIEKLDKLIARHPSLNVCVPSQQLLKGRRNASVASLPRLTSSLPLAALFMMAKNVLQPITSQDDTLLCTEEEVLLLERLRDCYTRGTDRQVENLTSKLSFTLDILVRVIRQRLDSDVADTPSMIFNDLASLRSTSSSSSCRNSPPGGPNSPVDDVPCTATDDLNTLSTSFLLPYAQPSPTPDMNLPVALQWSGHYGQQMNLFGRVGKRPRLPSEPDLFDMGTAFGDSGPLTMFDFVGENSDFHLFGVGR